MNVAICIDEWKLDIFTEELTAAGFSFEKHPGITSDTLTLSVETSTAVELGEIVAKAQNRCAVERRKKGMN